MRTLPIIGVLMLLCLFTGCRKRPGKASADPDMGSEGPAMQIGISYYPEQRPRESWNVDFELLVDAGIKRIRMGEFAWSTLEPREGEFDFHCFDDCIELAQRYGIQVVLCTPTAAPPVWLIEKYPEVLPVNADKQRNTFGARQHRCYNSPAYIRHSRIIVDKLAARYARHPNVVAWQIDNEMGGEQKRCHCEFCREAFQVFLKGKYSDISQLNKRWGNAFWSLDYQRFEQVILPYRYNATLMLKHHPSLELEFSRFSSNSIVKFSNMQADIIRQHNAETEICTNRFAYEWGDNVNSYDLNLKLDAAGFDLYSTKKHQIAFYADFNRSLNPTHNWVMEYGPDSKNLLGEMELMEARGVQWLYFFKLNPFPAGMEQSMSSLLTITGTPTPNYHVVKQFNRDRQSGRALLFTRADMGLYYDFDCSWSLAQEGWGSYREKLVYQACVIDSIYQAIFAPSNPVELLHRPENFQKVKCLILPQQVIYKPELETALIAFIKSGGTVISTRNLFVKNTDNVYLTSTPRIYKEVMSGSNEFFLDPPTEPMVFTHGKGKLVIVSEQCSIQEWKSIQKTYL